MLPTSSADHYRLQQQIDAATAAGASRLWRRMSDDFDASWAAIRTQMIALVAAGQLAAARSSVPYVAKVLAEQGEGDGAPAGTIQPAVFASTAPDGRSLDGLLDQAPNIAKGNVGRGATSAEALAVAGRWLTMATLSTVADTSREVVAADIAQRREVQGWVRMLNPPSCDRCAILAGKWYRWNEGFQRHPRCFPVGVDVSGPEFDASTRRWYEGELVVLHTASGQRLPITGNHPVLTDQGWVPANVVTEGSRVVRSTLSQGAAPLVVPHEQHRPTPVEDVWRAGRVAGLHRVPTTPEDFHGDGAFGEVDVVLADRHLRRHIPASGSEPHAHQALTAGLHAPDALTASSDHELLLLSQGDASSCFVSSSDLRGSLLRRHLYGTNDSGTGPTSPINALLEQVASDDVAANAQPVAEAVLRLPGSVRLCDVFAERDNSARWDAPAVPFSMQSRGAYTDCGEELRLRLSGQVELDRVIKVERTEFRGHVYNISSSEGWFAANGLIVSNCDCRHIPSSENRAGDLTTDPYAYFKSLTAEQQERTFGRSEARAIREGGDIYRVVNVRQRGLAAPGSRQAIKYGTPSRKTVDEIFRTAGTRSNAIRMLTDEGYITGPQVVGGNIVGRGEGYGQAGKGGRARGASDAVRAARSTGVRDPLNRYTMTAAERRLYDAKTRLDAAEQQGVLLPSIGGNSADRNTRPLQVTPARLAVLRSEYEAQLRRARTGPASVRRLAAALGITL